MEIIDFNLKYKALIDKMKTIMDEPDLEREIIDDGVYNPEKYFSNNIKICWMLKEPYDLENGQGGGWSYLSMFDGEDLYESTFKFGHRTTWHPIIYTSFGIHNGFKKWGEIEYIKDNHKIAEIVREVAFINAQKLPSKGVTRTNMDDIAISIEKHGELLKEQVELLSPNVFIFANTFHLYKNLLGLNNLNSVKSGSCNYYIKNESIFIEAYHPAQTQVTGETYVDDIINAVKTWSNSKN